MTPSSSLGGPLRKRESHLWRRHEHDFYVEPQWVSVRLFEFESFRGGIWDPAAGLGRIVLAARSVGLDVVASDIVDRGAADYTGNFFAASKRAPNIVSNPPFSIAEKFVKHALWLATDKVAMLLPSNWIQGDRRSRWLETTPLYRVWFIAPRPSMPPGEVITNGGKPGNGTTDYAWFVWQIGFSGARTFDWLHREDSS